MKLKKYQEALKKKAQRMGIELVFDLDAPRLRNFSTGQRKGTNEPCIFLPYGHCSIQAPISFKAAVKDLKERGFYKGSKK